MAKQAHKVASTIKAKASDSVIAGLETKTDTATATAPRAPGLRVGQHFTGQYLWNRLITDDKAEQTKMEIIRAMAATLDPEACKKLLVDFVAIPMGYRDNLIKSLKKDGAYDAERPTPELATFAAQLKTAQNHVSVLKASYGALKFCEDILPSFGYSDSVGYQTMRVIAVKALAAKGIKWDGAKVLNDTEAKRKASAKLETKALEKVMETTPRNDGETMPHYLARCGGLVAEQLEADNAERETKMIKDLIVKVRKLAGPMLDDVVDGILRGEGVTDTTTGDGEELSLETAVPAAAQAVKH
jgi:hypothetical protein